MQRARGRSTRLQGPNSLPAVPRGGPGAGDPFVHHPRFDNFDKFGNLFSSPGCWHGTTGALVPAPQPGHWSQHHNQGAGPSIAPGAAALPRWLIAEVITS